jgi:hypothetical protein
MRSTSSAVQRVVDTHDVKAWYAYADGPRFAARLAQ